MGSIGLHPPDMNAPPVMNFSFVEHFVSIVAICRNMSFTVVDAEPLLVRDKNVQSVISSNKKIILKNKDSAIYVMYLLA